MMAICAINRFNLQMHRITFNILLIITIALKLKESTLELFACGWLSIRILSAFQLLLGESWTHNSIAVPLTWSAHRHIPYHNWKFTWMAHNHEMFMLSQTQIESQHNTQQCSMFGYWIPKRKSKSTIVPPFVVDSDWI